MDQAVGKSKSGAGGIVRIPAAAPLPQLCSLSLRWRGHDLRIPYLRRAATGGPSILFVHGLGGAKENFSAAFQCPSLAHCELVAFDLPGTGLASYSPDWGLDVTALAELTRLTAEQLLPGPYTLAGASMGGLIAQLLIRRSGIGRLQRFVSFEGNLCPEDCMFSRRVIPHSLPDFIENEFDRITSDMRRSRFPGDHISANNMALNVDARAYHAYSFETVAESDSRALLEEFLQMRVPRLFIHGSANRALSYLPRLRAAGVQVIEVADSAHFMFYDNPEATFQAVGEFVAST